MFLCIEFRSPLLPNSPARSFLIKLRFWKSQRTKQGLRLISILRYSLPCFILWGVQQSKCVRQCQGIPPLPFLLLALGTIPREQKRIDCHPFPGGRQLLAEHIPELAGRLPGASTRAATKEVFLLSTPWDCYGWTLAHGSLHPGFPWSWKRGLRILLTL